MSAALQGTATKTLTGMDQVALSEAALKEQQELLQAQAQQAQAQAQQALGAYQQAAAQPAPVLNPNDVFASTLLSNIASVLGQTPSYRENNQQDLAQQRATVLRSRAENLSALQEVYGERARAAREAGDAEVELASRTKLEQLAKAHAQVLEETRQAGQREERNAARQQAIDLENLRHQHDLGQIAAKAAEERKTEQAKLTVGSPGGLNPADYIDSSESGYQYINSSKIPEIKVRGAIVDYARKQKIAVIGEREQNALDLVREARGNIDAIRESAATFLPKNAADRLIKGPLNHAALMAKSNPDINGFQAYRTAAIQIIQAIAGLGKGLRINQAEINAALKYDIPEIDDPIPVAERKLQNLSTMLEHVEQAAVRAPTRATPKAAEATPSEQRPKMSDDEAFKAYQKVIGKK